MACSKRKIFLGSVAALGALFMGTATFLSQAAAAQPEEACRAKCQAVAEQFKKERGMPLPPAGFNDCMESCMNPPQIRSEADIPNFCNTQCERSLRNISPGANPAAIKACTDRCIQMVTQKFRQSRSQGQKGTEKKQ